MNEDQLSLDEFFDGRSGKVQRNAHETSRKAAARIRGKSGTYRRLVFDALMVQEMSDFELRRIIGGADSTCRTRRQELVEDGLVEDSGRRGRSPSGGQAIIWRLTKVGWATVAALREAS